MLLTNITHVTILILFMVGAENMAIMISLLFLEKVIFLPILMIATLLLPTIPHNQVGTIVGQTILIATIRMHSMTVLFIEIMVYLTIWIQQGHLIQLI